MEYNRLFGPSRFLKAAAVPLILLVLTAGVLPFAAAFRESLFHDLWGDRSWAGFSNYSLLFRDRAFVLSLGITLGWASLSAGLTLGIGFCLACALLEARRGFKPLFAALLVPWGVPAFIAVPIWRMIVHGSGGRSVLSSLLGFELNLVTDPVAGFLAALGVDVWLGLPLAAFAVYASLRKLSRGVLEAARLDGARGWTLARWIYLPAARATLLVMGALEFVKSFKEFSVPFLMTAGGPPFRAGITERHILGATSTLEIFLYDAFREQADYGVPSAYAVAVGALVIAAVALWLALRRRSRREDPLLIPRPNGKAAEILWAAAKGIAAVLAVVSAAAVVYVTVWLSLSDLSAVYVDGLVPRFLSLRPYLEVLRDEGILRYFLNTLIAAGSTALLVPAVILPAAWLLTRARPARSAQAFALIEALGMAGGIHSLIPLYVVFRVLGLLDGYVPVVTVYLFHAVPFTLFTLKAYLERLPRSLEETAALEGMRPASYLVRVLAPLCAPALVTSMMAAFLAAWNGFLVPLVFLNDDRLYTIGVKLHSYVGSVASGNPRWNLFAAASVINLLIVGALFYRFKDPLRRSDAGEAED